MPMELKKEIGKWYDDVLPEELDFDTANTLLMMINYVSPDKMTNLNAEDVRMPPQI